MGCLLLAALLHVGGCQQAPPQVVAPDYDAPLPEGGFGLRRITDPSRMPDLSLVADQLRDSNFQAATQRSLTWFAKRSTLAHFPVGPISHPHAWTSVYAMDVIAREGGGVERLLEEFDIWESVGWDGRGSVLYTAYYTPIFEGSRTRTETHRYPLYKRPADLLSDPVTGEVKGRQTSAGIVPYPTRREIEASNMLAGTEIVWLPSQFDAFIIHVNGSAKINLREGGTMYVGHSGTNGLEYTSIRELLVNDGRIPPDGKLPAIKAYFDRNPGEVDRYINKNDRYVFFAEYEGENWPAGSMGFKVTPMRSLATDKSIFPRGMVVMVSTTMPTLQGGSRKFDQLMLDQDTGGAIRAAGRGDIYIGVGPQAGNLAGQMAAQGKLYYFILKRDRAQAWYDRMQSERN